MSENSDISVSRPRDLKVAIVIQAVIGLSFLLFYFIGPQDYQIRTFELPEAFQYTSIYQYTLAGSILSFLLALGLLVRNSSIVKIVKAVAILEIVGYFVTMWIPSLSYLGKSGIIFHLFVIALNATLIICLNHWTVKKYLFKNYKKTRNKHGELVTTIPKRVGWPGRVGLGIFSTVLIIYAGFGFSLADTVEEKYGILTFEETSKKEWIECYRGTCHLPGNPELNKAVRELQAEREQSEQRGETFSSNDPTLDLLEQNLEQRIGVANDFINTSCGAASVLSSIPTGVDSLITGGITSGFVNDNCNFAKSLMSEVGP